MKNTENNTESCNLFPIKDHSGHINHTTLAPSLEESIEEFMEQESVMFFLVKCRMKMKGEEEVLPKTWPDYQKEGYEVVKVRIVEV